MAVIKVDPHVTLFKDGFVVYTPLIATLSPKFEARLDSWGATGANRINQYSWATLRNGLSAVTGLRLHLVGRANNRDFGPDLVHINVFNTKGMETTGTICVPAETFIPAVKAFIETWEQTQGEAE